MPDIVKINAVEERDIAKLNAVDSANIVKVIGATKPAPGGVTATKWIAGAINGKVMKSTDADAGGNWAQIVDLGSGHGKGITIGEDASANKRWVLHRANTSEEISYVNDGLEDDSANWTEVNLDNNHVAVNGGPSIAWGNNYWIGVGDDIAVNPAPSDEDVLFASSDGGNTWATVELPGQQTNDTARVACYKDNTTFFFTIQDQIWKTTADPTDPNNWSMVKELDDSTSRDIMCMAYAGGGVDMWVCMDNTGGVFRSTDDWANAIGPVDLAFDPNCVIYCAGLVNLWVACGDDGEIFTSPDGASWTLRDTPVGAGNGEKNLYCVATDNTTMVAVGASGTVITSTNGTDWSLISVPFGTAMWSISSDVIGVGMR
jgi:hypothetical protein